MPCRKCGRPATRKGRRKRGKHCRRCDGNGKRMRIGRHLYNHSRRIHADGTRPKHRPAEKARPLEGPAAWS